VLNRLIRAALENRASVLGLSLLAMLAAFFVGRDLPVEVLPDLTKPTVLVLTEASGLAPEEVEASVTVPIERALMGVAGITRLRSNSDVGLSLVYAEFGWGSDLRRARQAVREQVQAVQGTLPEGVVPFLTPEASLMGEILLIGLRSTNAAVTPPDVRTVADWVVRPRLQGIPGIAEVLNMGGGIRQVQIQPDPVRMQWHGVTLEEVEKAAREAAGTTTGGFLQLGPTETMVRNLAMTVDLEVLGRTVVTASKGVPVLISDVATVAWGIEPMRGDGSINGVRGTVMSVTKAPGFDTLALTARIEEALAALRPSLPAGMEAVVLFRQADFIGHAIGNLREAIRDGAIMVAVVLLLFLLNVRTTFITLMAMPLSFAVTVLTFRWLGVSVNSMTLGGLAVAIGMVVDDAIVDVENVYRRLRENASRPVPLPRLEVIARASGEVRGSILYATLLIILVFLPLLGLSGVEGRLFAPIAVATIVSMVASFVVSLTVIPVLCSLLLAPSAGAVHRDGWLVRGLQWTLEHTLLRVGLGAPFVLLGVVGLVVVGAFLLYPSMGKDFLPAFREETALVSMTAAPGTSLDEMNRIADVAEAELMSIPEVGMVGRRLGRAERGDHVVPVSTVEFDVDFRESEGRKAGRSRAEILAEVRMRMRAIPGTFSVVMGPLADRIGHMLSGVSAPVAVKVFGPDLDRLREIGTRIQTVARSIPGLEDCKLDQQSTLPQLRIEADRERAAAYGITPGALNDQLSMLVGGRTVGTLRDGSRTIDLVLRLPEAWRDSPERIAELPVEVHLGDGETRRVPLSTVATVRSARGPNVIFREGSQRRFVVAIKPAARDVAVLVERLRQAVTERVALPEGYWITFEGEFEAQRTATQRIAWLSLGVLVLIAFLLHAHFRAGYFVFQVLIDIPLALVGGLVLTWWMLDNISIATLVGFIAVAGVSARNSIMLISHYLHLMHDEGEGFTRSMIVRGTRERLVPVLMTALSAGIGLVPLVLAADEPGKEILHPVAVVIVGGLVSSTLLGLGVTPAMFYAFGRKAALKHQSKTNT
jgi:CzcA family heavy metal efflux pump